MKTTAPTIGKIDFTPEEIKYFQESFRLTTEAYDFMKRYDTESDLSDTLNSLKYYLNQMCKALKARKGKILFIYESVGEDEEESESDSDDNDDEDEDDEPWF